MGKDTKWHCVDTDIYAGVKETPKCVINKSIRLSVAIQDDGSGVNFSHRIWTTFDNFDTDEESVAKPTMVHMSYHLRDADDVYKLVKQMGEALAHIKENSHLFRDYDVNVDIESDDKINISLERKKSSTKSNIVKEKDDDEIVIEVEDDDKEIVIDDD